MINQYDITLFGAVPGGEFDCTEAIQQALNAASETAGVVIVPPGVYKTGRLKLTGKNVTLMGYSAWNFRSDGASVLELGDETADCLLDITGGLGCAIRGICMNGKQIGNGIHGIKLYWDKYNGGAEEDTPTIDDCRIGNFTGDGVHLEHIWCFSVRHSMLHRNRGAGLFIDGWDGFILDNWFTGNGIGGMVGGNVVASITATGNRVEWNRGGGFLFPAGDSFNFTGNFFDRSFGPALSLGDSDVSVDLVAVTGNIFRRSGAHPVEEPFTDPDMSTHVKLFNCSNVTLTGNTMRVGRNDGGSGVLSPDMAIIVENCRYCIVKDNTMDRGSLTQNMVLRGDLSTCLIDGNIGAQADENTHTPTSLLN